MQMIKQRYFIGRSLAGATLLFVLVAPCSAQWVNYKPRGVPRTADGKPDLNAPTPKMTDGKPDLSGLWLGPRPYQTNLTKDLKPGELAMLPWAEALFKQRRANESKDDPQAYCIPGGVPRSYTPPYPFKIVSTPNLVVMLFEAIQSYRQIFTDGRELPRELTPTWMGYSVGRWEGDTLIVQTTGFKDENWIDSDGHPGSDALVVTERFRRKDFGHIDIEVAIQDPKAYAKPWTITLSLTAAPDNEIMEYICSENNKYSR
jgi:hypothetical protein